MTVTKFHRFADLLMDAKGKSDEIEGLLNYPRACLNSTPVFAIDTAVLLAADVEIEPNKLELPFDEIFLEMTLGDGFTVLFCWRQEKAVMFMGFDFSNDSWQLHFSSHGELLPDTVRRREFKTFSHNEDTCIQRGSMLAWFLTLLNQPNQRLETHTPSTKLNKKRVSKGRFPLVVYKTLTVIKPDVVTENNLGGSHASPRLHTRRGHFRKMVSGKIVWVSESLVGAKDNGLLLKDYRVTHSVPT